MFWRVASGSVSSSVEAILSGDNFTLEQLLAEDELVKVSAFRHSTLTTHRVTSNLALDIIPFRTVKTNSARKHEK